VACAGQILFCFGDVVVVEGDEVWGGSGGEEGFAAVGVVGFVAFGDANNSILTILPPLPHHPTLIQLLPQVAPTHHDQNHHQ